jgi:hypothetical protein
VLSSALREPALLADGSEHCLETRPQNIEVYREVCLPDIERLFSQLRGSVLLLAMLSFDHRCSTRAFTGVRLRDVNIAKKTIVINGVTHTLSEVVLDDVRDHVQGRLCGFSAVEGASRWQAPLFTDEESEALEAVLVKRTLCVARGSAAGQCLAEVASRHLELSPNAPSPLQLLDKGPRIVRRGFGGTVDAYYVWKCAGEMSPASKARVTRRERVSSVAT